MNISSGIYDPITANFIEQFLGWFSFETIIVLFAFSFSIKLSLKLNLNMFVGARQFHPLSSLFDPKLAICIQRCFRNPEAGHDCPIAHFFV
jgi:hypothetical protein